MNTHVTVLSLPKALFEEDGQIVPNESETTTESEVLNLEQCQSQAVQTVPPHLQLASTQEQIAGTIEQTGESLSSEAIQETKVI